MANKILITGYQGFIGTYLTESFPVGTEFTGLDIKNGDFQDILTCDLPDADVVIHLAAEPGVVRSVEDPYTNARTNILGTIRLLERYKDAKFIFSSSGGTIQKSIESPYGLSKYVCEEYIKLLHDNYVILRFPNVYGKGSRSVADKWINEDTMTIFGDGQTYRIYAHVSDIVEAIKKSVDWEPNETYKLGTDQRYTVLEVARYISGLNHKPLYFMPARKGEITHPHSELENTTPFYDWEAKINLMEYIKDVICDNS